MKRLLIGLALVIVCACVAWAKPWGTVDKWPQNAERNAAFAVGTEAGEKSDTWRDRMADYKDDKTTLGNRQAAFDASRLVATNKIAEATTVGKCQTAMEKMQNEIEDLNRCIASLKQMIADLKRATQAELSK
jgi:hypothetical protein